MAFVLEAFFAEMELESSEICEEHEEVSIFCEILFDLKMEVILWL